MAMLLRRLVIVAAVAMFIDTSMAKNYQVGAPNGGWDLTTSLQAWANTKTFVEGDSLTFVYGPSHNVLEVSLPDYDACLTNDSIQSYSGGNTVISLTSLGNRYFVCGTPGHCDRGMKVVINTIAASAPPPATPLVPPAATPSSPTPVTPLVPPAATPSSPTPVTPLGSPTASPISSPVPSPPKTAAPTQSPKLSPTVSPYKSPVSSPSKSPAISPPALSPSTPAADSPATPPFSDDTSPSTTRSSANKINVVTAFTMGLGFIIMMLLTL
ncbi:hypothetical protein ACH5RR_029045 [Cinchona calisaya]|uniref:Phytocyanin domain-containing protein n=1 Tax=Cinchona calisaya TaxID=153742 RepID=A0ABD2YS94_9GENT